MPGNQFEIQSASVEWLNIESVFLTGENTTVDFRPSLRVFSNSTGSLFGTASFASTSSYAETASIAISASHLIGGSPPSSVSVSSSWASASISSSFADYSLTTISASFASRSMFTTSASFASSSLTSTSASWASASTTAFNATSASWASSSISASHLIGNNSVINFVIDGGGENITTGIKGFVNVPFDMTITGWNVMSTVVGSIVVDIRKTTYESFAASTYGSSIAGSELPTLSSNDKSKHTSLTDWTTMITSNDILTFNVNSADTVTLVTISLRGTKT